MTATHFLEGKFTRAGADDESLTVPAVLSSELPVNRNGGYIEVLRHSHDSVDLTRFPLPVIESHDHAKVNIGVAEKPQITGGKLRATIRFGASARAKELFSDIKTGIVRNLSIGYQINDFTETKQTNGETVVTATRWQPFETSIVSIPADASAGFFRGHEMTTETQNIDSAGEQFNLGIEAERNRVSHIQSSGKLFRASETLINRFIQEGISAEVANDQFNKLDNERRQAEEIVIRSQDNGSHHQFRGGQPMRHDDFEARPLYGTAARHNGGDDLHEAMVDGLLLRSGIKVDKPHVAARDFANMRLSDIAETFTKGRGWGFGFSKSPTDTIKRALSTSDFPELLSNVAGKALMLGYDHEEASYKTWTKETTVNDFKLQKRIAVSEGPNLEKVLENGEYTYGAFYEKSESFADETFGKIVNFSRQAIINDDIGGFTKTIDALGRAASRLESDKVYGLLTGNPTMGDGVALFHANHKNLMTGAVLSTLSLGGARAAMRLQKGLQGSILNVVPRYLIVPAALESLAEQLVISAVDPSKQNPTPQNAWIRNLTIVYDARLDATSSTAWYLAADHSQVDTVERIYLEGSNGAFIDQEQGFDVDGVKIKCRLDFGVSVVDWIGLIKNPGT
jgi:phage head maturation protease